MTTRQRDHLRLLLPALACVFLLSAFAGKPYLGFVGILLLLADMMVTRIAEAEDKMENKETHKEDA